MPIISDQSATSIVKALGGSNGMARCPAHDDNSPSLHVSEKNGRLLVKCHGGCSQEAVINALRAKGLWSEQTSRPRHGPVKQSADDEEFDDTDFENYKRSRAAFAILRAAAYENAGAPEEYLRGRGITASFKTSTLLSAKGTKRLAGKELWSGGPTIKLAHGGFPAMVSPIASLSAIGCAAQVTWLSRDGKSKLATSTMPRQIIGPYKGGYVVIGQPKADEPLIIAEGIETAASAAQIARCPAIAALSATNMPSITVPPCSEVIIAADNDAAGRKAADDLARKLAAAGHTVRIALPADAESDWNDELQGHTDLAELRDALLKAKPLERFDAVSKTDVETRLGELAKLSHIEYERQRTSAAKELAIRASVLDREVAARRELDGVVAEFMAPVDPWPETVDGQDLLYELCRALDRHIVLPKKARTAIALWILHAHAHDAATHSPLLAIISPTKRCGKTTLLALLNRLVPKPLPSANVTAATVFRAIERWHPTLLIDEADAFLLDKNDLRGVINSGHERSQAFVLRCVGEDLIPAQFSTWSPKSIALIGRLHPTIEDRSLVIELRRKLPTEKVYRIPKRAEALLHLRRKCARWAEDHLDRLRDAEPTAPKELNDRAVDNWDPLLAIADAAGGEWPSRARVAAINLSAVDDDQTQAILLLQDLKALFAADDCNQSSQEIAEALAEMEDRPWPEHTHGKPITPRGLAKLLAPFKIFPKQVRVGHRRANGYAPEQFAATFERYLPGDGEKSSDTSDNPAFSKASNNGHRLTKPENVRGKKYG